MFSNWCGPNISLGTGNDTQFAALCEMLGKPELAKDKRFLTNAARVSARDELIPLLNHAFGAKSRDEWWKELGGHGFPCGPVRNVRESFECEQAISRGMA